MIKPIMKDQFFLSLPSEEATAADLPIAQDLLDTLQANREACVGMAANMIGQRKRIIAFADGTTLVAMLNPRILERAGAFETYECRLSAGLAFRSSNGQWEVERLSVADGGKTRSLEPLVGTWEGTFVGQETDGAKCLAGRGAGLALSVERAVTEGGVSQVSGTIAGMAHYHAHPAQDTEGCAGDLELVNVPFTATLVDDADGTLVLEATLPEDVGGTTSLTLRLGEKDSPTAATAEVTSSYQHTGSFLFFPVEETLTYVDVFTLTHVE